MNWFLNVYRQIPAELLGPAGVFLATLFTAAVAFTGVVLTNRAAERRQRVELSAAEKRASVERDQTLRKTIYLETLNDLGVQLGKVFDLWNVNKTVSMSGDEISKSSGSVYRSYLVASPRTVQALIAANASIDSAAVEALPLRVRYAAFTASRQQMESMLERIQKERERLVSELNNGTADTERQSAIESRKKKLSEMEQSVLEHLLESLEHATRSAMDILMLGSKRRVTVEKRVFALIAAIRDELSLPAVGHETLGLLADAAEEALKVSSQSVANLKAMIPLLTDQAKASVARTRSS